MSNDYLDRSSLAENPEQVIRISSKLERIKGLMLYASFMAWYACTSFDSDVLERQLDEKLNDLEGEPCLLCSKSGKKWTYVEGETFVEDCPICKGTGRVKNDIFN